MYLLLCRKWDGQGQVPLNHPVYILSVGKHCTVLLLLLLINYYYYPQMYEIYSLCIWKSWLANPFYLICQIICTVSNFSSCVCILYIICYIFNVIVHVVKSMFNHLHFEQIFCACVIYKWHRVWDSHSFNQMKALRHFRANMYHFWFTALSLI